MNHSSPATDTAGHVANATEPTPTGVWFDRLCLLAVFLACGLTMSPNHADADLWGHVQYGTDVWQSGRLPTTATYTYAAEGFRWINHENLSELVMAAVVMTVGPLGLVWGKFLLGLLVIGLIYYFNRRDGIGWPVAAVICALVAANLSYHWSIRPQLSTMVCFTLLIALVQFAFSGWRGQWLLTRPARWGRRDWRPGDCLLRYDSLRLRALWLAIPLFVVWANSHGGFVAGLLIYLVYLGMRGFEAICQRGRAGWGLVRRMALMGIGASLACLLNPYGFELIRWLAYSILNPRPEISEWNNTALWTLVGAKFWLMLVIGLVALCGSRRRPDLTQLVILGLTLWQATTHFRHVPFFAICLGFWLGPHVQALWVRIARPSDAGAPSSDWRWALLPGLACVLIGVSLVPRLTQLPVDPQRYPVAAVDFMYRHRLAGRTIVSFDWAQYVLCALGNDSRLPPERRTQVALDGRFRTCYPQLLIDAFFDFTYAGNPRVPRNRFGGLADVDPSRMLHYRHPELALISRHGEQAGRVMSANADQWVLLYQDSISQLWGRASRFDDPASPDYVPPEAREISEQVFTQVRAWPALPAESEPNHNRELASHRGAAL